MVIRFLKDPRKDLQAEVEKQLAARSWDTYDPATQAPKFMPTDSFDEGGNTSRYMGGGKGVFVRGQPQSYPSDILHTQEGVATATNARGEVLKQVGAGGSMTSQSYMGNRWQTAAPPPGSTAFYERNRARLDRSTESPYRAEIARVKMMADQQASDARDENRLKLRYLDPAQARADATRYGVDRRTGLGYDMLGLKAELGRGNLAARQGSLAERAQYHEAALKQNREIADMTDDRARQVIANNLSRDTNHQTMEQQRFALESRVRNLTDVDKAAIGHLDKLTVMATAILLNIENGTIPTASDAEKAAAIKKQTDAITAYQGEVMNRLKAVAPPVTPAASPGEASPIVPIESAQDQTSRENAAVDVNQNGIADSDEQALAWAKENAKTNPIKAKAITDAMKRKYPQVYGG